jgi:8-oxo-dGTP diphosphatase
MVTCTFENGNQASLRHAIVDAVVVHDGKILLVKRTKSLLEGGKWALVGGYMDRDETMEQAIRREVLEETGYQLTATTLLQVNSSPERRGEDRQNIQFLFVATAGDKTGAPDWESDAMQWFEPDKLPNSSELAFDHEQALDLYKKSLNTRLDLPVVI